MEISVVVPVYGCPQALPELHKRLTETLSKISSDYEIILVNDNCPKNSWAEIEKICSQDKNVVGIELSRNFGQQRAILAGLDASQGEKIVVMDCDLQDVPEDIAALNSKIDEGYDIVFAKGEGKKKRLTSKMFYALYSATTGKKYDPGLSNFTICKRKVINYLCQMRENFRAYANFLQWLGFKTTTIDVSRQDRSSGKSGYTFKKRLNLAMDIFISQTSLPITMIFGLGIFITIGAFLAEITCIILALCLNSFNLVIPSIFCCIFFTTGLIIDCLGVLGMYLTRIFTETKHRPLYIVRQVLNQKQQENNSSDKK